MSTDAGDLKLKLDSVQSSLSKVKVETPFLFEVKYNGRTSYILGTLHCLSLDIFPKSIINIIKNCNSVFLECVSDDQGCKEKLSNRSEKDLALDGILLPANKVEKVGDHDFFSTMPETLADRLKNLISILGLNFSHNRYRLDFLVELINNEEQILANNGMDTELYQIFKNRNKVLFELDARVDRDEVCDLEADYKPDEYYGSLLWMDINRFMRRVNTEHEIDLYCFGDIELVKEVYNYDKDPSYSVINRNLDWMPKILHGHNNNAEPCLFAFGVYHLFGAYGILNMLEQSGFTIRRMDEEGIFLPFQCDEKLSLSAQQSQVASQNYQAFMRQVVNPEEPSVSWLYSAIKSSQDFTFQEWKKSYQHPQEEEGYGPGAVVPFKSEASRLST